MKTLNNIFNQTALAVGFSFLLYGFAPTIAQECDSGKVWVWGMATSGCIIESGCYTPEKVKELTDFISECACEETSISMGTVSEDGKYFGWSEDHEWKDGHCIVTYWYYGNKEEIQLTATQFDSMRVANGTVITTYIGNMEIRRSKEGIDTTWTK